jgi:nitroimidazol reductase NimA-like FMN-containing flavoprotein (pyridoxamine 5'-phosphate oxidase superfamily)
MRKKEKEIKDKTVIESIIREATICRIGLSENDIPYIVPMNFGYKDHNLYLHSSKKGKKIRIIKKNNRVCFEIDNNHEIIRSESPCRFNMRYYSVIGYGNAYLIDDFDGKRRALDTIMEKYSNMSPFEYAENGINNVIVIRVEIKRMTGKRSGY